MVLRRFPLSIAPMLLVCLGAACSDADTGTRVPPEPDASGDIDTSPDVPPDASPTGDTDGPDVAPDPDPDTTPEPEVDAPAVVGVELAPLRTVYTTGLRVTPTVTVWGSRGAPLRNVPVRIEAVPPGSATADGDAFVLATEGPVTFRACVDDATLSSEVCGARTVVVDDDRPAIELIRPLPGAELRNAELGRVDDGVRGVDVEGRVIDSNGALRVFVQGRPAEVDRSGTFRVRVPVRYGINHIDVLATDMLRPRESRLGASVLVAEEFANPFEASETGLSSTFERALLLRLGQSFIDSNLETSPPPGEGPVRTRDLAGVLELVLQSVDLGAVVPDPVLDTSEFRLRVTGVTPGDARTDIAITPRGVEIFVAIRALRLDTLGFADVAGQRLNLDGGATMSLSASVRLRLRTLGDGTLDVDYDVIQPTLAVESIVGRFGSPQANAIVAVAGSQLAGAIEAVAIQAVREAFLDELPDLLRGAFADLTSLLEGQEVDLDLGFGVPTRLSLDGRLRSLEPTRRAALTATLDLSIGTDREPAFPASRGIGVNAPSDEEPSLFSSSRVQIAVRMEALNGLLHHLWNAGLLRIDASDVIPSNLAPIISSAQIDAQLPPHLRAARPDEPGYPLVLSLGQVELTISRAGRTDVLGLDVRAGANARLTGSRLQIEVQPEPDIAIWQIAVGGTQPLFQNPDDLKAIVLNVVWPELAGSLLDDLGIDLPVIDLGGVAEIAPRLAGFGLSIVLDRPLAVRGGFLVVEGGLDGTL